MLKYWHVFSTIVLGKYIGIKRHHSTIRNKAIVVMMVNNLEQDREFNHKLVG